MRGGVSVKGLKASPFTQLANVAGGTTERSAALVRPHARVAMNLEAN